MLVDETNQLWNFLQNFADEQAWTPIKIIKSPQHELDDKMNAMEWLSRTSPFLSPDVISKVITSFKDLFNNPDPTKRDEYTKAVHNSNAVYTVLDTI